MDSQTNVGAEDHAGVTFPPPFIYLIGLLAGIVADRYWPIVRFEAIGAWMAAAVLLLTGGVFFIWAPLRFRAHHTEVRPWMPATALVADGPYRLTRNPMYVGMALLYASIALFARSGWALVLLVPVMLIIRYAVIAREERYLEARFGDKYREYMRRVRRWL